MTDYRSQAVHQRALEWQHKIKIGNYKNDPPNIRAAEIRSDEGLDVAKFIRALKEKAAGTS